MTCEAARTFLTDTGRMVARYMKTVCLWSGPRNVSTALMYSFAQRDDTVVVDEPLYGHYLRVTGVRHPGGDEVMASVNCDGNVVMQELLHAEYAPNKDILFLKQMAHHLVELDLQFMEETENIFLVRDPEDMLPSLAVQLPDAGLADTGLRTQWQLYQGLRNDGRHPVIIDSRELLLDPAGVLRQLCEALSLSFDDAMLSWKAGARPEDGVWAKHWYHSVHKSTAFESYQPKIGFPESLRRLLDECSPYYDKLYAHAIRGNRS